MSEDAFDHGTTKITTTRRSVLYKNSFVSFVTFVVS